MEDAEHIPVQIAHELSAEESLSSRRQAHKNDDELLLWRDPLNLLL